MRRRWRYPGVPELRSVAWRASVLAAGLLAGLIAVTPGTVGAATVRDVRHITEPAMTRLIVELSEPVRYDVQRVAARPSAGVPARVYVDLHGVQGGQRWLMPSRFAAGPLQRVNAAPRGPATTRLILDVPGLQEVRTFAMQDPFRLVIDVRGAPRSGPASSPASTPVFAAPMPKAREPARPAPPAPASAEPLVRAAVPAPPARGDRRFKIVIDPGHGGKDPGAFGVGGLAEKDVVLAIAKRLADRLQTDPHVDVVLTRRNDTFLSLQERTARANAEDADLFVSIHANASENPRLAGVETYYLANTDNRATLRLAEMENGWRSAAGAGDRAPEASVILSSLVQNYKIEESVELASAVQHGVVSALAAVGTPATDLGVKQGPFHVLVGAAMPCVLVEVSFLTHPVEGKRLGQVPYQDAIAAGLLRGIRRFVEETQVAGNL
jgi:N-acetylmuramoyl-L-alanine amidase